MNLYFYNPSEIEKRTSVVYILLKLPNEQFSLFVFAQIVLYALTAVDCFGRLHLLILLLIFLRLLGGCIFPNSVFSPNIRLAFCIIDTTSLCTFIVHSNT